MAPIRITNWIQSQVHMLVLGQHIQINLNWRSLTNGNWTNSELNVLNNNIVTAMLPEIRAITSTAVQFIDITSVDNNPTGSAAATLAFDTIFGVAPGEVLPLNVTDVISWRTGLRGRNARGRNYMPPTGEPDMVNGVFSNTYVNLAIGFTIKYLSFANAGGRGVHAAMASRAALVVRDVFNAVVDNIPDSMRRRLQGRGR